MNIRNPLWRFHNLYYVKHVLTGQPVLFKPKPEQLIILKAVYEQRIRKILIPKARQLGISTVICLIILDKILFNSGFKAAIVDRSQADATTKLQDKIVFAYERLPATMQVKYDLVASNNTNFAIRLKREGDPVSEVQAGMHARGDTFQMLHISEWGKIQFSDQLRSEEILTGALPAAKLGVTFIETTWKGGKGGHLWKIMDSAIKTLPEHRTSEDFHLFFFPWWGDPDYSLEGDVTQIPADVGRYLLQTEDAIGDGFRFTKGQALWYYKVAHAKGLFRYEEYPSTLDECFKSPIEGSIYGDLIDRLRMDRAIRPSEIDRTGLVNTCWDLGSPINTVVWYFQLIGAEIRVIDLDMDLDLTPTDRVARMLAKGYPYGWHFLPHDARATQKSGITFENELNTTGLQNTRVVPQALDVWVGINHLRELLPRFTFRVPACDRGIEALSCYHTKRETAAGTAIDIPFHDWSSHPADALRVVAEADLAGMLTSSTSQPKHRILAGYRGSFEKPKPRDVIDEWFDDVPQHQKIRR